MSIWRGSVILWHIKRTTASERSRAREIIGEAVNRILSIEPDISIENARRIVDTRNWVIHGYDKVDDVIVWGIISMHLPLLRKQVENLLMED